MGYMQTSRISDYALGRDNNFNLLRFAAASAVVLSHSYILAAGERSAAPLTGSTGHDLGYHAVNVFFSASGFLVAASWLRAPCPIRFLTARVLRLWPALILCTLAIVFAAGPLLTSLPLPAYFVRPETWSFIPGVVSLLGTHLSLPGVMSPLAFDSAIDAPLWTLKYEFLFYLAIVGLGVLAFLLPRRFIGFAAGVLLLVLIGASFFAIAHDPTRPWVHIVRFGMCFGFGAFAALFAERIPLSVLGIAAAFLATVLLAATPAFEFAFCILTAYATLWAAFVPGGVLRGFNRLGDYSYGIYIYAYPVQLILLKYAPGLSAVSSFLATMLIVLPLTLASWHLVEQPCLRRKDRIAGALEEVRRRKALLWSASRRSADSSDPI